MPQARPHRLMLMRPHPTATATPHSATTATCACTHCRHHEVTAAATTVRAAVMAVP